MQGGPCWVQVPFPVGEAQRLAVPSVQGCPASGRPWLTWAEEVEVAGTKVSPCPIPRQHFQTQLLRGQAPSGGGGQEGAPAPLPPRFRERTI